MPICCSMTDLQVGVNIDGDSKKLLGDCLCPINGWLDLRCAALKRRSYGMVLALKIKNFDYDINIEFDKNVRVFTCLKMFLNQYKNCTF